MLTSKHILSISDLTPEDILLVLDTAESFAEVNQRHIKKLPTLRGQTVVNLFFEPSTRTRTSFEIAAKRLSADAINFTASASATVKGETLRDTAKTLSAMACDLVIIRHRYAGAPWILAEEMDCSVVNGGDGSHEHPTQALLDLYTMRQTFGHLEGLRVGIVGDICHSRVAGSLSRALAAVGATPVFIGPATLMPACPAELSAEVSNDFDAVLPTLDVAYMLRVQFERAEMMPFPSNREYAMLWGMNARRAALLPPDGVIMHPGPLNRGVEITADVADSDRSVILYQVQSGVAVRMAVMYLLLGGGDSGTAL